MVIIENYKFGKYDFDIVIDDAAITGDEQLDVYVKGKGSDYKKLRSFFFDDSNPVHVKRFCKKYGIDDKYRKAVDAHLSDWCVRDRLFLGTVSWTTINYQQEFSVESLRTLFQWFKLNTKQLLVNREFIDLCLQDVLPNENFTKALNLLESNKAMEVSKYSQGIQNVFDFNRQVVIPITPNTILGHVDIRLFSDKNGKQLGELLSGHNHISLEMNDDTFVLQSKGDNLLFSKQLIELATEMSRKYKPSLLAFDDFS